MSDYEKSLRGMTLEQLRLELHMLESNSDSRQSQLQESVRKLNGLPPRCEVVRRMIEFKESESNRQTAVAFKAVPDAGAVAKLIEVLIDKPSSIQLNELQLLACLAANLPYKSNKSNALRNIQNAWGKDSDKRTESEQLLVRKLQEIKRSALDAQLPQDIEAWLKSQEIPDSP